MRTTFEMNIQPDLPSINGRIYPKEVCEKMVKDLNNKDHYLYVGSADFINGEIQHPSLETVAGIVEHAQLDDSKITIDGIILDTICGKDIKKLLEKNPFSVSVAPAGIGSVSENKIQNDYEITSLHLIQKDRQA